MSLFLHSSNADESAVRTVFAALCWGAGKGGGTHYNVGLGLTVHDQSSSTELFYIEKAIGAHARTPGGGVHGRAGEVDWH